jgi:hypothetical protein
VGVSQVGRDLDLPNEAFGAEARGKLGPEDLDGNVAVMLQVLGEIDGGHTAAPDLPFDLITVGKGLGEGFLVFHGTRSSEGRRPVPAQSATHEA